MTMRVRGCGILIETYSRISPFSQISSTSNAMKFDFFSLEILKYMYVGKNGARFLSLEIVTRPLPDLLLSPNRYSCAQVTFSAVRGTTVVPWPTSPINGCNGLTG